MRLTWSKAALADLDSILEHLPPDVAENTARRVDRAVNTITAFPHAAYHNGKTNTYERYVPRTRVVLIYQIAGDTIELIAVFHTSRDPESKPGRT